MPSYMQCIKCSQQMERTVNELLAPINAEMKFLREKLEAWEWYDECRQCMEWLYAVCWNTTPVREAEHSFLAAARAVHADRE